MSVAAATAPAAGERVVVAMSGGVDSSLAAALAVEAGCDVVGVTMKLSQGSSRCCSLEDADDARSVADSLGVRFYVADYSELFHREVVLAFADDYLAGRTPIPCIACNKQFKFDHLLERAHVFGASRVATGHYADIGRADDGTLTLLRGSDRQKDQSYFLFQLNQKQLAAAWFPLGPLSKSEVRERARAKGLATADKPESQEICFVPGRYVDVIERVRPEAKDRSGELVDEKGKVLGRHPGVHHFTVGQRHGLGLPGGQRYYVTQIDSESRQVTVGDIEAVHFSGARVGAVCWIGGAPPAQPLRARVQVRHRHEAEPARVEPQPDGRVLVHFDTPVRAVSPGQAAVFYDEEHNETLLGGGFIERGTRDERGTRELPS